MVVWYEQLPHILSTSGTPSSLTPISYCLLSCAGAMGPSKDSEQETEMGQRIFCWEEVGAERLVLLIFNPNNFSGAVH